MRTNLILEITSTLSDYNRYGQYLLENQKIDLTNRLNKVKYGAISTKQVDCLIKLLHLSEFLKKEFNEVFEFPGELLSSMNDYKQMINTIELVDGSVQYTKEYADILNGIENKIAQN